MTQQKVINAGKLAFNMARTSGQFLSYIHYDINEGCLTVNFKAEYLCKVDISIYQAGFLSGASEKTVYSNSVSHGHYSIRFKPHVLDGFGAKFMSIHVNGELYFMQRL